MTSVWTLSHLLPPPVHVTPAGPARRRLAAPPRATDGGASEEADPTPESEFDDKLAQMRRKYRSGSGKKAELRRGKKNPGGGAKTAAAASVMLPPVPLKEPVNAEGLTVELGFTPYAERVNGRLALLGLAALVLVELGSGKGLLNYHTSAVIFTQVYTVAAVAAMVMKLDKERISVWPGN